MDIHISDMKGLPENLDSLVISDTDIADLKGLPKHLSSIHILRNFKLTSFRGGEFTVVAKEFKCHDNWINNNPSERALQGIPIAASYRVDGFTDEQIQAAKKNSEVMSSLDKDTKDTFGDFMSEL